MKGKDLLYEKIGKKHGFHFTIDPIVTNGQRVQVSIWGNSYQEALNKMDEFLKEPAPTDK